MDGKKIKKVTAEGVAAEMSAVLKEKSLAKITRTEKELQIRLINGQCFRVEVKEE